MLFVFCCRLLLLLRKVILLDLFLLALSMADAFRHGRKKYKDTLNPALHKSHLTAL